MALVQILDQEKWVSCMSRQLNQLGRLPRFRTDFARAARAPKSNWPFRMRCISIANRRMFDTLYAVERVKARETGHPLSLVIDIDYFKQYNDHYGHMQRDECLRHVAQVLDSAAAHSGTLCARLGGEEFVLLLPAPTQQQLVIR